MYILLTIVSLVISVTAQNGYTELFGDPYRNQDQTLVFNKAFATMTSTNSVTISYQGFAQVPSSSPSTNRILFFVHPADSTSMALPYVYISANNILMVNITTSSGLETFTGPQVTRDSWFSFGVIVANGASSSQRYVRLCFSALDTSDTVSVQYKLQGNMAISSTAMAYAQAVIRSSSPAPVYLLSLRVFTSALTVDWFDYYSWLFPPNTYAWQMGTELGVFGFERKSSDVTVGCAGTGLITNVNKVYYGRPKGLWPNTSPLSTCNANSDDAIVTVSSACLNRNSCVLPQSNVEYGDPCSGMKKWIDVSFTCSIPLSTSKPSSIHAISSQSTAPSSQSKLLSVPRSSTSSSLPSRSLSPVPSTIASAHLSPSPGSSLGSANTVGNSLSSIRSRRPFQSTQLPSSKTTSAYNAWRISLTISLKTSGVTDKIQKNLITAFINDMSTALNAPTSRFDMVEFQDQTQVSTTLSFVILPNATDSDATELTTVFAQQIQISGSDLRAGTLLIWANPPPVALQVVGTRVTNCYGSTYVLSSSSCPTSSPALSSFMDTSSSYFLIAGSCLIVVLTVIFSGCFCWCRRRVIKRQYQQGTSQLTAPTNSSFLSSNGVMVGLNHNHQPFMDGHGIVHGSFVDSSTGVTNSNFMPPPTSNHHQSSPMIRTNNHRASVQAAHPLQRFQDGQFRQKSAAYAMDDTTDFTTF